VWFDPTLSVVYWPRESWTRLVRQFRATGAWRGELVRRYGWRNSLRFFAPPALVAATGLAAVVAALQLTRVLTGLWSLLASVVYLPLLAYAALVTTVAAGRGGGSGWRDKLWTLAVLPTMHLSWGAGFLAGLFTGARDTVDTSRLGGRNTPLP
jgi:hypothetical protein